MSEPKDKLRCDLCGREVASLTRHHLIPRTRHKNRRNKRDFERSQVKRTVRFCRPCHKMVHATLSEKELESGYNTPEAIAAHPEIATFLAWVRRRPGQSDVRVHRKGGRRNGRA